HVESFLGDLDYPAEKRPKTMRLVRRLFGRARPTGRELRSLRGLFRRASQRLDRELSGQQDRSE
ncbi:MAG: RNA methyltransferase, partial [Halobacteriales archaeon]